MNPQRGWHTTILGAIQPLLDRPLPAARIPASRMTTPPYRSCQSDQLLSADTNRLRELRDRLQSRRQVCAAGALGYGRTGGLRAVTAVGILQSTRHPNRLLGRHARFSGQCQTQGGRTITILVVLYPLPQPNGFAFDAANSFFASTSPSCVTVVRRSQSPSHLRQHMHWAGTIC